MDPLTSLTVLVDGGASGCRLQARNAAGKVCGEAQSGPASLSLGTDPGSGKNVAWQNILSGLSDLGVNAGFADTPRPAHLVMGLAGALHDQRRTAFLLLADQWADKVTLVTDGHAQLLGATDGKPGACLAVGTGSVLHWITAAGKPGMAGGWGFPAGDDASGAWLGLMAVKRYTRRFDLNTVDAVNEQNDPFYSCMQQLLGTEITDIQSWTTCKSPTRLARLAPELVKLMADGSDTARDILAQGTQALEHLLQHAPPELPLFLAGGLADTYRPLLSNTWQQRLQQAHGSVFDGLWYLAVKNA